MRKKAKIPGRLLRSLNVGELFTIHCELVKPMILTVKQYRKSLSKMFLPPQKIAEIQIHYRNRVQQEKEREKLEKLTEVLKGDTVRVKNIFRDLNSSVLVSITPSNIEVRVKSIFIQGGTKMAEGIVVCVSGHSNHFTPSLYSTVRFPVADCVKVN